MGISEAHPEDYFARSHSTNIFCVLEFLPMSNYSDIDISAFCEYYYTKGITVSSEFSFWGLLARDKLRI
jgi:hypothetical protein